MTDVNDIMTEFSSFSLITPLSTRRGVGGEAVEVGWGYFTFTNTFSPFSIASVILRISCWTHCVESST